jgi:hypothetical protein
MDADEYIVGGLPDGVEITDSQKQAVKEALLLLATIVEELIPEGKYSLFRFLGQARKSIDQIDTRHHR